MRVGSPNPPTTTGIQGATPTHITRQCATIKRVNLKVVH